MNKSGARPTRKQKEIIASVKLDPRNWLVVKNLPEVLQIRNKQTGMIRTIS